MYLRYLTDRFYSQKSKAVVNRVSTIKREQHRNGLSLSLFIDAQAETYFDDVVKKSAAVCAI